MHRELRMVTSDLANFLQQKLPDLSPEWWENRVVGRLSFQQQRIVKEKRISSLRELDLAALLRVFDQNWFDLANGLSLPWEARNWVKELQTVRNKWAHMAAEETPASEIYRDADTLGRFLDLIDADTSLIEAVKAAKDNALAKMAGRTGTGSASGKKPANAVPEQPDAGPTHLFKVGDVVALRSDKSVRLPVLEVITSGPEVRYCVFQDGAKATYYEIQLQAVAMTDTTKVDAEPVERPERHNHLTTGADRIRLYALNRFIEPARERGAKEVSIRAGDIAAAMGLMAFPNICQALGGKKFQRLAQVPPPLIERPDPSSSTTFTYKLNSKPEEDDMTDADRIRLCALNYFIEPARERGAKEVSIRASDLAAKVGLMAFPNICQALGGEKFQRLARVPPPSSTRPNPSSSTTFTYKLNS